MKKIFILFCLLFLLCSCTAEEAAFPDEFDADVEVRIGEKIYTAIYEKRLDSDTLIFVSPENLSGLTFALSGGIVTATVGETTLESDSFKAVFDFLPVTEFGTKSVGDREYTINERSMK